MSKKIIVPIVSASLLSAIMIVHPAFAVLDDYIEHFANNNITFYNPEECVSGGASDSLSGDNIQEKAWNYFRGKGLSEAQTAGVLGNIEQESSFIITEADKADYVYWGLFQMNKNEGYAKELFDTIKSQGLGEYLDAKYRYSDKDIPDDIKDRLALIQFDYAWEKWSVERQNAGWKDWREEIQTGAGSEHEPEYAAEVFVIHFEGAKGGSQGIEYYSGQGSSDNWQDVANRRSHAVKYYNQYAGKLSAGVGSGGGACCDPNDIVQTYQNYPGKAYELTDSQVRYIAQTVLGSQNIISNEAEAKSVLSFKLNVFEKDNPDADAKAMIKALAADLYRDGEEDKSTFTNDTLTNAVTDIIVKGNRILPAQVTVEINKLSEASIVYNGTKVSASDSSKILRGITEISSGSTTMVFWDYPSPGVKSNKAYGYFKSDPPASSVLAVSAGTSVGMHGSAAEWEDGWIKTFEGYTKEIATSTGVSGLKTSFGTDYTTDSPSGTGKGPTKISLYVTGSSAGETSGVLNMYSGSGAVPHFTVDLTKLKTYQHGSIYKAAAAGSTDAKEAGVQIAIIGYGSATGTPDLSKQDSVSESGWKYLAKLMNAISIETGISFPANVNHSPIPSEVWNNVNDGIAALQAENSSVCPLGASGSVQALWSLLKEIAWPDYKGSPFTEQMPKYTELINSTSYRHGGYNGNDCGGFVGLLLIESGWDKDFPPSGTWYQEYDSNGTSKRDDWKLINDDLTSGATKAEPGDVLITNHGTRTNKDGDESTCGHILIYVGKVDGFNSEYASASLGSRSPMADARGSQDITTDIRGGWDQCKYNIYRKIK